MREGRKWLRLLVFGLLACTLALAGCSGDDGDDGIDGQPGQDFQLPAAEQAGLLACSTCHGTSTAATEWVDSKHAMNSSHSIASCATACHNPSGAMNEIGPAFGVTPTGTVVGCEDCHGAGSNHANLPLQEEVANTAPTAAVCGQCHNGEGELAHLDHHPFNEQIYSRYAASGHGNSDHGGGFCAACHSHQGGVFNIESGRKISVQQLFEEYSIDTVPFWSMEPETGLLDMQCNTCHDPHKADLRTEDTVDADGVVVYSAEFNLCTSCHMIDLNPTPSLEHEGLYEYELTDAYSATSLVDADTSTFKEVELTPFYNADGTLRETPRVVYETQVFYHDNTPHGGRNFSDTHFAGQVVGRIAAVEEDETQIDPVAVTDVEVAGYNINAANPDACTVCHDPHSANKVEGEGGSAQAASFAEGIGDFHTNYLGDALGHGCQPCHNGQESFVTWVRGGSMPTARTTDPISCRTCHELEQVGQDAEGNPVLGDPTAVRAFAEGHEFAFNSGVVVDVADLGVNQICFECHKGRTPAPTPADEALLVNEYEDDLNGDDIDEVYVGTENRTFAYLHYAPGFATLFGDESGMVPTYDGTYAGKFVHGGGAVAGTAAADFGCVTCHNVHDTDGNNVVQNKMVTSADCAGCHQAGAFADASALQARTEAFSVRLLETLLGVYLTADGTADLYPPLQTFIDDLQGAADDATRLEMLATYLEGRTNVGPSLAAAKAATAWKIFTYEDGAVHGPNGVHGHGGSWAHNSRFARQVMFDAITDLDGDTTGLTRP